MLPQIRMWRCLVRPFYRISSNWTNGNLIEQFMLSRQNDLHHLPIQNLHVGNFPKLFYRHSQWNRTLLCKCSTVGDSEIHVDDGLKTDTEEESIHDTKIKSGGSDEAARIEAARLEIEVLRSSGALVPDSINDGDLEYFTSLNSKKPRKRFLAFLYKKDKIRLKEKEKRRQLREERELLSPKKEDDLDGPMKNRFLLLLQQSSILQFDNWRLASGMKFGPKVVYDFSYDEHMKRPEIISLVKQLMVSIGANKLAKDPFDIHWVGLQDDSATMREMKRMQKEHLDTIMVSIADKQVQDIFPVEDIVYLTSDSPNILRSYDPSKVYVMGALVDSHKILRGESLARAKRLDLNHARLPLDLFLKWSTGGKNLTLDQMIQILIELNTSGDWVKALSHVPTRKHTGLKSEQPSQRFASQNREQRTSKEDPLRQKTRYSSSRAQHSRSWPVLEETPFQRSKKMNSTSMRQRVRQVDDNEDDPANETIFSPSGGYGYRKSSTQGSNNKGTHWTDKD